MLVLLHVCQKHTPQNTSIPDYSPVEAFYKNCYFSLFLHLLKNRMFAKIAEFTKMQKIA